MLIITEKKLSKRSYFIIEEKIGNTVVSSRVVDVKRYSVIFKGKKYHVLYDSKYNVIEDAYMFLNHRKKNLSANTIEDDAYNLRYLYSYTEIINKDIKEMDYDDFVRLAYFLKGISVDDTEIEIHLLANRNTDTVNQKFSTYREFYKYLRLNPPIFEERSFSRYVPATVIKARHKSRSNILRSAKVVQECPKYISPAEFKKIIEIIRNDSCSVVLKIRNEIVVRIMYEAGLRLGETLGLTLEDLEPHVINNESTDKEICYIYIRNRLTDNSDYQNAKGCLKVNNKLTYSTGEYKTKNRGYQLSFISMDTYDLICEYIDKAHAEARKKKRARYETAKADAVASYKEHHKDNYYLLLNSFGSRLSDESWRSILREIFIKAGISIDHGKRKDGLSHRFRHGFCMHLLYDLKMPKSLVRLRSRHSSEAGLDKYDNPTTEQLARMTELIEQSIIGSGEDREKHDSLLKNNELWK